MKPNADGLDGEVLDTRRTISSDGYPMSIGELTNLYRDGELIIRPQFQRIFRWTNVQKSRLIESILLGIPIPSIFVSQQEKGKWELVDGLQRVSTILEFQGELRDKSGNQLPPVVLGGTKFLPSLEGCSWSVGKGAGNISDALRLDFKRSKLDVKIIKRESSPQAKYDLFQRLNAYSAPLTAPELRSAVLVSISPEFFEWIESLVSNVDFKEVVKLSDRDLGERHDLELIERFLVLHNMPERQITVTALRDFPTFLTDRTANLAMAHPKGDDNLAQTFRDTFATVANAGAEDVFRRWDPARREFGGGFLNTAFEVFALGLGYHIANRSKFKKDLISVVKSFWERPEMQSGYATGKSTEARLAQFIPIGRELLAQT